MAGTCAAQLLGGGNNGGAMLPCSCRKGDSEGVQQALLGGVLQVLRDVGVAQIGEPSRQGFGDAGHGLAPAVLQRTGKAVRLAASKPRLLREVYRAVEFQATGRSKTRPLRRSTADAVGPPKAKPPKLGVVQIRVTPK